MRGDAVGRPVAIELGALTLDLLGNHRFRHLDFRGNVKLVSDAAGRIVSHARYAPYGADLVEGVPDREAGFAQGRSAGADLVLLGARLYDPEAARFLAPDSVFQLVNQYAYADGNPIWYWDPDGRIRDSTAARSRSVPPSSVPVSAWRSLVVAGTGVVAVTAALTVILSSNAFAVGAVAP